MIYKLATEMASIFVTYGVISTDDKDIYTYACESLLSVCINIFLSLVISALYGMLLEGIVFTFGFALLRHFTGGHHAKSHKNCILSFVCILAFTLSLIKSPLFIGYGYGAMVLLASTISFAGIFTLAPVEHKNKPLSFCLRTKLKKRSRALALVLWAICVSALCAKIENTAVLSLSLSMLSVFGSMTYATLNKTMERGHKYERV